MSPISRTLITFKLVITFLHFKTMSDCGGDCGGCDSNSGGGGDGGGGGRYDNTAPSINNCASPLITGSPSPDPTYDSDFPDQREHDDISLKSLNGSNSFGTPWTNKDISFVGDYIRDGPNDKSSGLKNDKNENTHPVMDGGMGWLIVFITFLINALVAGTTFTLGVSIPPLWDRFNVSEAAATFVGSVLVLSIMSSGPLVGYLVYKYGCRPVMFIGGIIQCIGSVSCVYSSELPVMILTFSLIGGIGLGFLYISAIIIIGFYFKNRIALASGIAMCGTSVGTFAFNPLREYMQDIHGWNRSTSIFGGLGLICSCLSLFLRSPEPEEDLFTIWWNKFRGTKNYTKPKKEAKKTNSEEKSKLKKLWKKLTENSPLKNKLLCLFLFSSALSMMGFTVPLVFMGEDGKNRGINPEKAVFLFSIIAFSDGAGRFIFGIFCQKTGISPLKIKTVWIAVASIAAVLIPSFSQYAALACLSACIGLGYGSYIAMVLPIFVSLVETKHIPAAVGAENLFSGIAIAICAPVAGALYGAAGNLATAFYYSGASLAAAVLVNIFIMYYMRKKPPSINADYI
ncbi:Monocarboxylate transporter 2 [Nymphon striatum]|nr:Monocarboxylate transporter 2 [Nymphon striatum]